MDERGTLHDQLTMPFLNTIQGSTEITDPMVHSSAQCVRCIIFRFIYPLYRLRMMGGVI